MSDDPRGGIPDSDPTAQPFADLQSAVEDVDLHSTLQGYEPPPAGQGEHKREKRLCLGCNTVQDFVDDRCLNCGYRIGEATPFGADMAYTVGAAYAGPPPALKWILGGLAVALLGVAVWLTLPMLKPKERATTDAKTVAPTAEEVAKGVTAGAEAKNGSFIGALETVVIDDALRSKIAAALRAGNDAWKSAGTRAYVYRYSILDETVPATSQKLTIAGYADGKDAAKAVTTDGSAAFRTALDPVLKDLSSHSGVTALLTLQVSDDVESVKDDDVYVVYGYNYGREHMTDIQPVIDAIEDQKKTNGQYPLSLDAGLAGGIRTKGNPNYIPNGFGYIPIFRTDGSGNILMGTGSAIKRMTPAEVTGYYLLKFTQKADEGVDLYSKADLTYYTQKISPFPYQNTGPVKNMPLTKDGKPDGIGAVIKNGKLEGAP